MSAGPSKSYQHGLINAPAQRRRCGPTHGPQRGCSTVDSLSTGVVQYFICVINTPRTRVVHACLLRNCNVSDLCRRISHGAIHRSVLLSSSKCNTNATDVRGWSKSSLAAGDVQNLGCQDQPEIFADLTPSSLPEGRFFKDPRVIVRACFLIFEFILSNRFCQPNSRFCSFSSQK